MDQGSNEQEKKEQKHDEEEDGKRSMNYDNQQ